MFPLLSLSKMSELSWRPLISHEKHLLQNAAGVPKVFEMSSSKSTRVEEKRVWHENKRWLQDYFVISVKIKDFRQKVAPRA